jgi:hypothetical protein
LVRRSNGFLQGFYTKTGLKNHAPGSLLTEGKRFARRSPVKVMKDPASRFFVSGYSSAFSSRNVETEVEPVHAAIADGESSAAPRNRAEESSGRRKLRPGPPGGRERRRQERRQRQTPVLLDTRVAQSRRQDQSIDEST